GMILDVKALSEILESLNLCEDEAHSAKVKMEESLARLELVVAEVEEDSATAHELLKCTKKLSRFKNDISKAEDGLSRIKKELAKTNLSIGNKGVHLVNNDNSRASKDDTKADEVLAKAELDEICAILKFNTVPQVTYRIFYRNDHRRFGRDLRGHLKKYKSQEPESIGEYIPKVRDTKDHIRYMRVDSEAPFEMKGWRMTLKEDREECDLLKYIAEVLEALPAMRMLR
ncbi:hypothetical protein BG003_001244, partial [Podila horticola]